MSTAAPPRPTLWLITSRYLKPVAEMEGVTAQHRKWLEKHYRSGLLLTGGRRADGLGGVLLALRGPQDELEAVFAEDPYVLGGYAAYTIVPFHPGRRSPLLNLEEVPLAEVD